MRTYVPEHIHTHISSVRQEIFNLHQEIISTHISYFKLSLSLDFSDTYKVVYEHRANVFPEVITSEVPWNSPKAYMLRRSQKPTVKASAANCQLLSQGDCLDRCINNKNILEGSHLHIARGDTHTHTEYIYIQPHTECVHMYMQIQIIANMCIQYTQNYRLYIFC